MCTFRADRLSLLTVVDDREALEVGLVGREGMVGIPLALRIAISPVRALVQDEGSALKMSAGRFSKAFDANTGGDRSAQVLQVHARPRSVLLGSVPDRTVLGFWASFDSRGIGHDTWLIPTSKRRVLR